jgi:hypothetical protein
VLKHLNFQVSRNDIGHIITATPDTIERVLMVAKVKINEYLGKPSRTKTQPATEATKADMGRAAKIAQMKEALAGQNEVITELKDTVEVPVPYLQLL